jgi:type III secretion system YscJ/HrcJ family lipoprotein
MPAPHSMTPLSRLATAALAAATLMLAACSEQELYGQLSERQANEMVAVLRSAGIAADKTSQEGKFSVITPRNDFSQAVRTLNAQGYPRESFDTMGKVFKREGFVSSPLEERARLMHATSQEIANTIANIDGVVTARVHLVMPERNPLVDKLRARGRIGVHQASPREEPRRADLADQGAGRQHRGPVLRQRDGRAVSADSMTREPAPAAAFCGCAAWAAMSCRC